MSADPLPEPPEPPDPSPGDAERRAERSAEFDDLRDSSRGSWGMRIARVSDSGDRSATPALVRALLARRLNSEAINIVCETLCALEDVRVVEPLERAIADTSFPPYVRLAALEVLGAVPRDEPPREQIDRWLRSADGIVRAHGVSFLDVRSPERIATALGDPDEHVRRAASDALVSLARTPLLVESLRRALRDPDWLVREAACRAALFDEPLCLTFDLLRLLGDEDGAVRLAACDALEDFPCVSVLLALADARSGRGDAEIIDAALAAIVQRVRKSLGESEPAVRSRLERWMAPAAWIIEDPPAPPEAHVARGPVADNSERVARAPDDSNRPPSRGPVDVALAERVLLDSDSPPARQRELLLLHSWDACGARGVGVLAALAESPNWSLRQAAVAGAMEAALAGRADAEALLLRATEDHEPFVRRSALHACMHAGLRPAVDRAVAVLEDPRARPVAGDAALHVVALMGRGGLAETHIVDELERADDRDGLKLGAAHLAERLGMTGARGALAALAGSPVVSGVGTHVVALRALRGLDGGPRPDLGHLDGVDHLDVQRELGAWDWHGPRFG